MLKELYLAHDSQPLFYLYIATELEAGVIRQDHKPMHFQPLPVT
jgi:hypothetical protein